MTWILGELCHLAEDLDVPPPIQSRMYQEISNAMVGFENCVKISDVPFPFPYAQLLNCLVLSFACFMPVSVACFTRSFIAGPIITFVVWCAIWGVNQVAQVLENPFGTNINCICLEDLHASFLGLLEQTGAVLDVQAQIREKERIISQEAAEEAVGKLLSDDVPVDPSSSSAPTTALAPEAPLSDAAGGCKNTVPSPRDDPIEEGNPNLVKNIPIIPTALFDTDTRVPPEIVSTNVKHTPMGANAQVCLGGAGGGSSHDGPLQAVRVIDSQLAQIGARMEAQLAQIAKELGALSVVPAMVNGRRGAPVNSHSAADFVL
jgi:hypothetical protein